MEKLVPFQLCKKNPLNRRLEDAPLYPLPLATPPNT